MTTKRLQAIRKILKAHPDGLDEIIEAIDDCNEFYTSRDNYVPKPNNVETVYLEIIDDRED